MGKVIAHTEPFTGRTTGQGERELPPAELGARFYVPDTEAKKRLNGYLTAERMLDPEQHPGLYQELHPTAPRVENHFWVSVDIPGMLSRLMRHYTFGPEFRVQAEVEDTQPEVDRITRQNKVFRLFRQVTESLPGLGDAVLRVDLEDVENVSGEMIPNAVIRYVAPHHYFPDLDPMDSTRVRGVTLAWVVQLSGSDAGSPAQRGMEPPAGGMTNRDDTGRPNLAVLREVHRAASGTEESGTVEFKLNRWDGKELGDALPLASHFPELDAGPRRTGIRRVPIVHVGYQTKAGQHFGTSEFLRIMRLFLALENRLSQEDEVLEKHARPKLIVGPGVLDEEGKANLADFDIIEIEPDILEKAIKPEYLTWDMQIQGITHEVEKLEEYLFMVTETSPASFGLERDGSQVESARALKFKAHRTVNKVQDQREEWVCAIRELYTIAQQLELNARDEDSMDGYDPTEVEVQFGAIIVEDQTQETQDMATLKQASLVSTERALQKLFNLTPQQAEEEAQRILQNQVDEAAAAAVGRPATPPPGFGGPPTTTDTGAEEADRAREEAEGVEPGTEV